VLSAEAQGIAAWLSTDLERGSVSTSNVSLHLLAGVGYEF
jgi:hypothetical protein